MVSCCYLMLDASYKLSVCIHKIDELCIPSAVLQHLTNYNIYSILLSVWLCATIWRVCLKVSNQELLHAVIALYAVSLSEMAPDTLYASVCEKWARTIILLRDVSGKNVFDVFMHKISTGKIIHLFMHYNLASNKHTLKWFHHNILEKIKGALLHLYIHIVLPQGYHSRKPFFPQCRLCEQVSSAALWTGYDYSTVVDDYWVCYVQEWPL